MTPALSAADRPVMAGERAAAHPGASTPPLGNGDEAVPQRSGLARPRS